MYFRDTLRYRNLWLGIAMLWIVIFHIEIDFGVNVINNFLVGEGYAGVDICLFASGIGCYYSLSKDSDSFSFFKRRVKRIMPTYLIFIVLWIVYKLLVNECDWQMAVGNVFAVQSFTGLGGEFNWYISAIFLMYILAPYFKAVADKDEVYKQILFIACLIAFSIPFWGADTFIITITRLPIFYIGMLFGKICRKDKKITTKSSVWLILMFVMGVVFRIAAIAYCSGWYLSWSCGLYWYPYILITPPLCIGISYIARCVEKLRVFKGIVSAVSVVGSYSFEVYLLHIPMIEIVNRTIARYDSHQVAVWAWIGGIVGLFAGCFVLRKVINLCMGTTKKKKLS